MASSLFSLFGEGEDEDDGVDAETATVLTLEPDDDPEVAETEDNNVDKVLETFGTTECLFNSFVEKNGIKALIKIEFSFSP